MNKSRNINKVIHNLRRRAYWLKKQIVIQDCIIFEDKGIINDLEEFLELAVSQADQCPICKRWDFRELGHVSDCFMRTLPNGNKQDIKEKL